MTIPLVPLIDLANSAICAFASVRLYQAYQRDTRNRVLLFFAQGYFALVISYLFFAMPRIFLWDSSLAIALGYLFAQAFLYAAVAYFSKVSMFFINVQRMQMVFWIVAGLSVIAMILTVMFLGMPSYNPATSITDWDFNPIVSVVSTVILGGVLFASMVFFFWQGIRSRYRLVKIRSIIIACGLLLLIVTTYTYYASVTPLGVLISDLLSLMSYLVIFFGIIYGRERHSAVPALTPKDSRP